MLHVDPQAFNDANEVPLLTTSLDREAVEVLLALDTLSEELKALEADFLAQAKARKERVKSKLQAIRAAFV
ncbi:MAG: hypothetical protein EB015_18635 [Methylocystaceae bacterium]|jgi:hypothetical protein|nr:hypothetical protein [Methylocystaceae bacterium]